MNDHFINYMLKITQDYIVIIKIIDMYVTVEFVIVYT